MRFEIVLEGKNRLEVPLHYNYMLQSFVYKLMGKLSDKVHDQGFGEYRKFKLFVFSKLFPASLERKGRKLILEPPIRFFVATPLEELASSMVETLLSHVHKLENMYVSKVNVIDIKVDGNNLEVFAISPITAYRTFKDSEGKHKTMYFHPAEREFKELLERNLRRKYRIVYGKDYEGELSIEPLAIRYPQDYRRIIYKGILVKAWEGRYRLNANKDMLELALLCGLGAKNSQGFGMVREIPG